MTTFTSAFLFPGQGAQSAGMGMRLKERFPDLLDDLYAEADDIVGYPLTALCAEGTRAVLRDMTVTQPAVFLTSHAASIVAADLGLRPDVVVGHSLGEYAALAAAGVLDWRDALRLVHVRGKLMRSVHRRTDGKMAAVIGVPVSVVDDHCAEIRAELGQVVEIANENEPTQVVVSGESSAVDALLERIGAAGAERTLVLRIGGPAHSSLMADVSRTFEHAITATSFADPTLPLLSSSTAGVVPDGAAIQAAMRLQLVRRVRWVETMTLLVHSGLRRTLELGPGKVLTGIVRRQHPQITTYRTEDEKSLGTAVEEWFHA